MSDDNLKKLLKNHNTAFQRLWRPAMGWSYLLICLFDFLFAPMAFAVFQAIYYKTATFVPWVPLTLGGGGLYHIAMLAINTTNSYGRTQEKIAQVTQLAKEAFNPPAPPTEPDVNK